MRLKKGSLAEERLVGFTTVQESESGREKGAKVWLGTVDR